ncbi:MAG: hypothetical protein OXG17_08580 [Chloroflexi bacterium]|nr:hypothetical protein [Chloroflexota bacterium]
MTFWTRDRRLLFAIGALVLLAACASVEPEPPIGPTVDVRSVTPRTARTINSEVTAAVVAPARAERASAIASPTTPRLPVAEDLGPNYFELFASTSDSRRSGRGDEQVGATVVAFGFSERAKLRDERIERDGPLAAVVRLTRHPSIEAASGFAAAAVAGTGREASATRGATSQLGFSAMLTESASSRFELPPDLLVTRSLQTGWLSALDGSRTNAVLETWTTRRARTVLTLVVVWGSQVNESWGESLIQRLLARPARTSPHAL